VRQDSVALADGGSGGGVGTVAMSLVMVGAPHYLSYTQHDPRLWRGMARICTWHNTCLEQGSERQRITGTTHNGDNA